MAKDSRVESQREAPSAALENGFCKMPHSIFSSGFLANMVQTCGLPAGLIWIDLYRRSFGWQRETATVSLREITYSTGICERSVRFAIESLLDKGYLELESALPGKTKTYRIVETSRHGKHSGVGDTPAGDTTLAQDTTPVRNTTPAQDTTVRDTTPAQDTTLVRDATPASDAANPGMGCHPTPARNTTPQIRSIRNKKKKKNFLGPGTKYHPGTEYHPGIGCHPSTEETPLQEKDPTDIEPEQGEEREVVDMPVLDKDEIDLLEIWMEERKKRLPALGVSPEISPKQGAEEKNIAAGIVHGKHSFEPEKLIEILRFALDHDFHGSYVLQSLLYFSRHLAVITADFQRNGKGQGTKARWATPNDDESWEKEHDGWTTIVSNRDAKVHATG